MQSAVAVNASTDLQEGRTRFNKASHDNGENSDDTCENENPDSPDNSEDQDETGYLVLTFNNSNSHENASRLEEPATKIVATTRLTSACLSNAGFMPVQPQKQQNKQPTANPAKSTDISNKRKKTIQIISASPHGALNAQVEIVNGQRVVRLINKTTALQAKVENKLNINTTAPAIQVSSSKPLFVHSEMPVKKTDIPSKSVTEESLEDGSSSLDQDCYESISSGPFPSSTSIYSSRSKRMLKCEECQKYYRNGYSLQHHICLKRKDVWRKGDVPTQIVDGKPVFYCPTCKKPFRWLGNLTRHFYVHTGQRFFKCDLCNKEFFSAYQVRRHMNSHTGLRFKCEICAKPFTCKYACAWHTRQHYNPQRAASLVPKH